MNPSRVLVINKVIDDISKHSGLNAPCYEGLHYGRKYSRLNPSCEGDQ